jgi:hypothetical protein
MLKNVGFEIVLASPPEYNGLVAEVYFDGRFVALVNQERGRGLFDVEMPGDGLVESRVLRRVDLQGFVASLEIARRRLSE